MAQGSTAMAQRPSPSMLDVYIPQRMEDAQRVADILAKSGACGRNEGPAVFAIMMAGARYGLDPITATRTFFVADGKIGIYASGMHALVLRSNLSAQLGLVDDPADNGCTYATWRCQRRDGPIVTVRFTREDAERAGLWGKRSRTGKPSPWVLYPDRMLTARALTKACRQVWPDVVAGFYTMDEIRSGDIDPDVLEAEFVNTEPNDDSGRPPNGHSRPVSPPQSAEAPESATGTCADPASARERAHREREPLSKVRDKRDMPHDEFGAICDGLGVDANALVAWLAWVSGGNASDLRKSGWARGKMATRLHCDALVEGLAAMASIEDEEQRNLAPLVALADALEGHAPGNSVIGFLVGEGRLREGIKLYEAVKGAIDLLLGPAAPAKATATDEGEG